MDGFFFIVEEFDEFFDDFIRMCYLLLRLIKHLNHIRLLLHLPRQRLKLLIHNRIIRVPESLQTVHEFPERLMVLLGFD